MESGLTENLKEAESSGERGGLDISFNSVAVEKSQILGLEGDRTYWWAGCEVWGK